MQIKQAAWNAVLYSYSHVVKQIVFGPGIAILVTNTALVHSVRLAINASYIRSYS